MRGSARRAVEAVQGSVVVLGVAVAWVSLVSSLVTWTVLPLALGWTPYVVMSDSMRPSIAAGDVVLVSRDTDDRPLTAGEVALMADENRPDGTRLHRFLRVDDEGRVVTKGDANVSEDAPVPASQVVGRTRIVVPGVGLPAVWLDRGQVVTTLAVVAATFVALAVVLGQGPGDGAARARRGAARVRQGRAPARHVRGPVRRTTARVPLGVTATLLVVVVAVVHPAAPGMAAFRGTATNGTSTIGANAWMGYTWTVTNDGAPASWWRLNDNAATTTAAPAAGTISGTYMWESSATFVSGTGVNLAVPPAAPTRNGAQNLDQFRKIKGSDLGASVGFDDAGAYTFDGRKPFSVEIWFRLSAQTTTFQRVVSKEQYIPSPVSHTGWMLVVFPSTDQYAPNALGFARTLYPDFTSATMPGPLTLNTWYHAVGTYDGTTLRLYVNGQLVATQTSTLNLGTHPKLLRVGDLDAGTNEHLRGAVDEFAVYTSVLTPRQVRAHYLAGSPAA